MLLQIIISFLFIKQSMALMNKQHMIQNWTSCQEFVNNTIFNPDSVVNIEWKIFYFWNPEIEETYNIQFSRPPKTLLDRFRVELDEEIRPPVNWTDADLFMETSIDFSALFIKTNTSGIYRVIPSTAFEYNAVPVLIFALKVVEPGILGIENCKHRIGYALAPVDKMPYHYELEKAAKTLNFYNSYNRSHISFRAEPFQSPYLPDDTPDDDMDEDMDVEAAHDRVQFF